jgi:hypothetical protein
MLAVAAALALIGAGIAYAAEQFQVTASEFDPGNTHLVQGEWLSGIGCPTKAKTATPNASFTGIAGFGTYTDPACPTGDSSDKTVQGLLLAKTGPSVTNFASAIAQVEGVKGEAINELGWDIRKPGAGLAAGERGSHCGAGAPRWNIETHDGRFFFLGCNSPPAPVQNAGDGFVRMRWGGSVPLLAFEPAAGFKLVDIRGLKIKRLTIVFDEGYDTSPDNFGLAVLDNVDVNGVLVGKDGNQNDNGDEGDNGNGDNGD